MFGSLLMLDLLNGVYWFDEALQSALRRNGWDVITRSQSLVFANIANGESRQTRIAKNLGVTRQAISQTLSELEQRGLVTIEVDPSDRRARIIKFSESSTPLRDAARSVLQQLEAELQRRIGDPAFQMMRQGLRSDWGKLPVVDPAVPPPPRKTRARAKSSR